MNSYIEPDEIAVKYMRNNNFNLRNQISIKVYSSRVSRKRLIVDLAVSAAFVLTVYAPPAIFLLHRLHSHTPTTFLLIASFPQNVHVYLALWEISIFLMVFLKEAP